MNYKVFLIEIQDILYGTATSSPVISHTVEEFSPTTQTVGPSMQATDMQEDKVAAMTEHAFYEYQLDDYLTNKISTYKLAFNTYIPGKRIVIESIGVDAPIVDVAAATPEKIAAGNFDKELKKGVVRYPFTSDPGENGSTLLFGHSSVDAWSDKQKFGYIFYKLPKLEDGDLITMFRDGQLHKYEVDKKVIKRPSNVAEEVASYDDDHYITLMACYPLMSDAKRILVRAREVTEEQTLVAKN